MPPLCSGESKMMLIPDLVVLGDDLGGALGEVEGEADLVRAQVVVCQKKQIINQEPGQEILRHCFKEQNLCKLITPETLTVFLGQSDPARGVGMGCENGSPWNTRLSGRYCLLRNRIQPTPG